ncbi:MAG: hypothetical protein JSS79_12755 [Bacteroidetes bacterium]|nr:hypothetical protein [Bacteroidota bacterium]
MRLRSISIILFLSVSLIKAQAQDTLKAKAKSISTELNVNLFQGSLSFNNALQQIKVRYFRTDDVAYRFGFIGSYNQYNNQTPTQNTQKTGTFGVNLGLEKHFKGTRRLSPYIGAELSFVAKWSKQVFDYGSSQRIIKGGWIEQTSGSYTQLGYFRYGANFVSGFDYYPAKNFFFGYEFTFQLYRKSYSDVDDGNGTIINGTLKGSSEFFIGPNLINGIRLGYIF